MLCFRCYPRSRILFVLLLLFCTSTGTFGGGIDPYRVLGISHNTSKKEIQKRYRRLCLQYHPDKNGNKSMKEREKCEKKFKEVQEAYDMIQNGTWESRPQSYTRHGTSSYANTQGAESLFRAFGGNGNFFFYRTNGPGFGMQTPFPSKGVDAPFSMDAFKSIYVQKVRVPLEDLYKGVQSFRFELRDNLFTRYKAAIRGKSMCYSLMLSFYACVPFIRSSKLLATVVGSIVLHATTPEPDPRASYVTSLRKGAKGGHTNVKFSSPGIDHRPGIEIIFEIEEKEHPVYRRVDNNLHAEVTITSKQAEKGCRVKMNALDRSEKPIEITIPPKTYSYEQQKKLQKQKVSSSSKAIYDNVIRIRGRGWPIRNTHHSDDHPDVYLYGDLFVTVKVSKESFKRRGKRG
ncbi:unnamed protein product [Pseudo-nitzschia multistriata]|uniref:J domain-containing protein n=1 Tax=Pseudo-nitzschia multistriata TaxID=183589 RepID=A0A448ZAY7_9STRA|nr:unnamed protein product [Pseudo-nitzschia multistriata]